MSVPKTKERIQKFSPRATGPFFAPRKFLYSLFFEKTISPSSLPLLGQLSSLQ